MSASWWSKVAPGLLAAADFSRLCGAGIAFRQKTRGTTFAIGQGIVKIVTLSLAKDI
jgi:hypothetical protein